MGIIEYDLEPKKINNNINLRYCLDLECSFLKRSFDPTVPGSVGMKYNTSYCPYAWPFNDDNECSMLDSQIDPNDMF